jgi:DNA-binding LacI/PurR family transcriptional regulator
LTTVAVDKELLGMQAVWNLVERIRHPELQVRETRLRISLTIRSSTAEKG